MAKIKTNTKSSAANRPATAAGEDKMPLTTYNYKLMLIGLGIIILGFILMAGGGSDDPDVFDYSMFSFRRITLAPVLVLGGFAFEIYAIMARDSSRRKNSRK